ncbi:protein of unknown function (plasmid) [Thermococcus nautili]|nr:protein of unknown function [Thermococcus nautili]
MLLGRSRSIPSPDPLDFILEYWELKSEMKVKSKPAQIKMLNPEEEEAVIKSLAVEISPSNQRRLNKA